MSRKENALDLAKFVDKGVRVKLSGGREGTQYSSSHTVALVLKLREVTFDFLLQYKVH